MQALSQVWRPWWIAGEGGHSRPIQVVEDERDLHDVARAQPSSEGRRPHREQIGVAIRVYRRLPFEQADGRYAEDEVARNTHEYVQRAPAGAARAATGCRGPR